MYVFKNAFVSIVRNKGRNLLIGIIVVVIACACAVTLAIRNSASALIESYQNKYEVVATIGVNRESMREGMKMDKDATADDREANMDNMKEIFSNVSSLTVEEIENYGDSEYVDKYYYQKSIGVDSDSLTAVSSQSTKENIGGGGKGPGGQDFQNMSSSDFTLIDYSSLEAMEDFISGKYSITSGEVSDNLESYNCVINSELAVANNIEVGNEIVLVDPDDSNNSITLVVTGIYEETSDSDEAMGMFTSSANTIITNTNMIDKLVSGNSEMKVSTTPSFVLTSKDVIEKFSEEVTEKGLSEYLSVSTNLDQVEEATSTISNVSVFATTFLVITLIIGGLFYLLLI